MIGNQERQGRLLQVHGVKFLCTSSSQLDKEDMVEWKFREVRKLRTDDIQGML